jgi:glucose/arabinose dehydrogenase
MTRRGKRILALLATGLAVAGGIVYLQGPATAATTRYEAENATISQGAVESNHLNFSGTGFVNTDNVVGSSVTWTINADTAGSATLAFRFANGTTTDRPMEIRVNGTVVSSAFSFPGTGNWDTWQTRTLSATLTAGINSVKATATTANGGPNLDFLDVTTANAFTDLQAENAVLSQATVATNHTGFTGSGFVDYVNVVGGFVEFTVNAPSAGPVSLAFRYANGSTANRPMDIRVNGTVVSAGLAFNPTTNWDTWATVTINANLNAGANTVRATATVDAGGPNLDRLRVSVPLDTIKPTAPGQPVCSNIGETSLTLTWGASTDNVGVVQYNIFHDGTEIADAPGNVTTKDLTGLNANFTYRLSVFAKDAAGNVSDTSPLATCMTKPIDDPNPPTAPTNLQFSNVGQTTVTLTWGASTDDRGVTAYNVRNSNEGTVFTVTGNPPPTTANVTGLPCGTSQSLHVVARDAAGNTSPSSNTVTFTTSACSRGNPQTPTVVSSNWTIPWDICWVPGRQEALITERDGFGVFRLTLSGTKTRVGTVPNVSTTDGEGGLLGCALSPTWNGTTDLDVFFMHTSGSDNRIVRMTYNGTSLSTSSTAIVTGIRRNRFHNGGRLRFGPDGFLYATTGEAQQPDLAQDRTSLNGKILRFTKTGAPAPGNPFGTLIYSYGHRNPQGLAWDSAGRLWESEFGNATHDEINLITPGANYGWPKCEGSELLDANRNPTGQPCTISGLTNPKWERAPSVCSCSGIAIVNDTIYMGALRGTRLWRVELNGTSTGASSSFFVGTFGRIRAVEKIPGVNAIWFGTSNADNNGGAPDGSDAIRRSNIQ